MNVGVIGLGNMGNAVAHRIIKAGHRVVGFDSNVEHARRARDMGVEITECAPLVAQSSRIVWLMLPAGPVVDQVIQEILPELRPGDIIIDGGNSFFEDSIRRYHALLKDEILFLDCGTSGGLRGRAEGFCVMVGGDHHAYERAEWLFKVIAAPEGYEYVGPAGAGHYVKMVHNGIEYSLLQAYAEGFQILKEGRYEQLDLEAIARVWNHGSVIRSWLLSLLQEIMEEDQALHEVSGRVDQGGTGMWTAQEARMRNIPTPCLDQALVVRAWSQQTAGNYATKLIALTRHKFGGHCVYKKSEDIPV